MARPECEAPDRCRNARSDSTPMQYRLCVLNSPHIDRNFAGVLPLKRVGGRFRTPRIDASFETAHDRRVPCSVEIFGMRL
jgi:hypothetical protein